MKQILILVCSILMFAQICSAEDKFDTEKMMSDLEKQYQLSKEKLEQLKPVLDEKSAELKKSIQESVNKGFSEWDKLSGKLETLSEDTDKKVQEILSSEEVQKLHEYLGKINKEAIEETKNTIVEEFVTLLALTEEQIENIKPMLEDSFNQLGDLLTQLSKDGAASLDDFKIKYKNWSEELKMKLEKTLDDKQLEKLEIHSDELEEKIRKVYVEQV